VALLQREAEPLPEADTEPLSDWASRRRSARRSRSRRRVAGAREAAIVGRQLLNQEMLR
jgi:hypothetical protein